MNPKCKQEWDKKRDVEDIFPPFSKEDALYHRDMAHNHFHVNPVLLKEEQSILKKNSIINQEKQEEMKRPIPKKQTWFEHFQRLPIMSSWCTLQNEIIGTQNTRIS